MRRIIRGLLAVAVLIFCCCAVGMTGRKNGTSESREAETVPESRETGAETVPESRETEAETVPESRETEAETVPESRETEAETVPESRRAEEETMDTENAFYSTEITDELMERMRGKSWKDSCTLPREDLRYLHLLHRDLEGEIREGEMVCNVHIADTLLEIFRELYEAGYPIEKIRLVDEYGADDESSMADNNSSCFNFRFVSYTKKISKHGLGMAVDINPRYNPYVKTVDGRLSIEPANGAPYVDRSGEFPFKIDENDLCYRIFRDHGFEWGGSWKNSKDYQHFEVPTEIIRTWYPDYGS